MAELLQNIVLSDITLFLIMGLLMVLITSWAFQIREYAGYLLGWMIGFLFVLLISAFNVGQVPAEVNAARTQLFIGPAVFLGLVVASILGLIVGVVSLAVIQVGSVVESRVARALIVAAATSFNLAAGYLMFLSDFSLRLVIAAFALAVAIGALFNYILMRQRTRQVIVEETEAFPENGLTPNGLARPSEPVILTDDLPSPLAQRIQQLRQRARRFGE